MEPLVAIVGRPNVGKSTLFNRLVQSRLAIVEKQSGVTRDRLYLKTHWLDRSFILIDTGGIIMEDGDKIEDSIRKQAQIAIEEADLVLLVVDLRSGLTSMDLEIAGMLRKTRKPVTVVANKADTPDLYHEGSELYSLGFGEPVLVSAVHGLNTGDLLDNIVGKLPEPPVELKELEDDEYVIKTSVVGRPNVGKSSLINVLLEEERMIVTDIPGTTRDAVDSFLHRGEDKFLFIDTAGIRRKSRIYNSVEYYSVLRSFRAMENADVAIMVIDAKEMVTEQDKRIAGHAHENGKGIIIGVNKWDLITKENKTVKEFTQKVRKELTFLQYAPVIFVSAKTKQRVFKMLDLIKKVAENRERRVSTGVLNNLIREVMAINPPPGTRGKSLKIYYATQVKGRPPTFLLFVNDPELLHFSYKRFLENRLREAFDFEGTPLRIVTRRKR